MQTALSGFLTTMWSRCPSEPGGAGAAMLLRSACCLAKVICRRAIIAWYATTTASCGRVQEAHGSNQRTLLEGDEQSVCREAMHLQARRVSVPCAQGKTILQCVNAPAQRDPGKAVR